MFDAFVDVGKVNVSYLIAGEKDTTIEKELQVVIKLKNKFENIDIISYKPEKVLVEISLKK